VGGGLVVVYTARRNFDLKAGTSALKGVTKPVIIILQRRRTYSVAYYLGQGTAIVESVRSDGDD
jgi:hypothetical protein